VFGYLEQGQLVEFLKTSDPTGSTPLHCAATSAHGAEFLEAVAKHLEPSQLEEFLKEQDQRGFMPLHCAARSEHGAKFMEALANLLNEEQLARFLETKDCAENTPFNYAVLSRERYGAEFLMVVVNKLPDKCKMFLGAKNRGGDTPLDFIRKYYSISNSKAAPFKAVLDRLGIPIIKPAAPIVPVVVETEGEKIAAAIKRLSDLLSETSADRGNIPGEMIEICGNIIQKNGRHILEGALKFLGKEQLAKLLEAKDSSNNTSLHLMARNKSGKEILEIIARYLDNKEQLAKLLEAKDSSNNTPLHLMAQNNDWKKILEVVAGCLNNKEQLARLLEAENDDGNTPLHLMVRHRDVGVILEVVAGCLNNKEQLAKLLGMRNRKQNSPLDLSMNPSIEGGASGSSMSRDDKRLFFLALVENLELDQLEALLRQKNSRGNTLFHEEAKSWGSGEAFKVFLGSLADGIGKEKLAELLGVVDEGRFTPLHLAANPMRAEFVEAVVANLEPDQLAALLEKQDSQGNTPFHVAMMSGEGLKFLEMLHKKLGKEQLKRLLEIQNDESQTPLATSRFNRGFQAAWEKIQGESW
jgi:ankyrin repeat protein